MRGTPGAAFVDDGMTRAARNAMNIAPSNNSTTDFFFTNSPVSFLWPFEVAWSSGYSGWGDVLTSIFFQGFQDVGIIIGSAISIIFVRLTRRYKRRGLTLYTDSFQRLK